jgi:hypothetical protein
LDSIFKKGRFFGFEDEVDDLKKDDRIQGKESFVTDCNNKDDKVTLNTDDILVVIYNPKTNTTRHLRSIYVNKETEKWPTKKRITINKFHKLDITTKKKNNVDNFANKLKSYLPDEVTLAEIDELKADNIYGTHHKKATEGTTGMPFYEKEGNSLIKIEWTDEEGKMILWKIKVNNEKVFVTDTFVLDSETVWKTPQF